MNSEPLVDSLAIRAAMSAVELDQIRDLLRDYNAHLFTIIDPALLRHRETELAELPGSFAPPLGVLLLATAGPQALGCVGLRPLDLVGHQPEATSQTETAAECCRMWVANAARGRALGRRLIAALIEQARAKGYSALYLNCAPGIMAAAHRLYLETGFVSTSPYKPVPIPGIQFFRLAL